jgi:hypothetical protein
MMHYGVQISERFLSGVLPGPPDRSNTLQSSINACRHDLLPSSNRTHLLGLDLFREQNVGGLTHLFLLVWPCWSLPARPPACLQVCVRLLSPCSPPWFTWPHSRCPPVHIRPLSPYARSLLLTPWFACACPRSRLLWVVYAGVWGHV